MKNTKKVNVYPRGPIITINPPVRTALRQVTFTYDQIRKCLISGAIVEEILANNTVLSLNLNNYNKDNTIQIQKPVVPLEKNKTELTSKQQAEENKQVTTKGEDQIEEKEKEIKEPVEDAYEEADSKGL